MATSADVNMVRCDACSSFFQFGPQSYRGTYLPSYQVTVCESCYRTNWDGWAPHFELAITANLRSQELAVPARNAAGLLPRE